MNTPNFKLPKITRGTLLIASPQVSSGIFFHSVVLICDHVAEGTFGLILNKPLKRALPPEISANAALFKNTPFCSGGIIQPNNMLLLHSSPALPQETLQICNGVYLGGNIQFLQETLSQEEKTDLYIYLGYTGWGKGQLEQELMAGQWFLYPASPELIFKTPLENLWHTILKEMGGKYSIFSLIPEDVSLN